MMDSWTSRSISWKGNSFQIAECVPNLFQFLNSLGAHSSVLIFFTRLAQPSLFLDLFFSGFSEFGPYALFRKSHVLSSFQWISDSPFSFSDTFFAIALKDLRWIPLSNYIYYVFWVGFDSNWYIVVNMYLIPNQSMHNHLWLGFLLLCLWNLH